MTTVSIAVAGEIPSEVIQVALAILSQRPYLQEQFIALGAKLDDIEAAIIKLGIDQSLVDQIFKQVGQNKEKLETALGDSAEP